MDIMSQETEVNMAMIKNDAFGLFLCIIAAIPSPTWCLSKGKGANVEITVNSSTVIVAGRMQSKNQSVLNRDHIKYVFTFGIIMVTKCYAGSISPGTVIPFQRIEYLSSRSSPDEAMLGQEYIWLLNQGYVNNVEAEIAITMGYPVRSDNYFGERCDIANEQRILNVLQKPAVISRAINLPQVTSGPICMELIIRNPTSSSIELVGHKCEGNTNVVWGTSVLINNNEYPLAKLDSSHEQKHATLKAGESLAYQVCLEQLYDFEPDKLYNVEVKVNEVLLSNKVTVFATSDYRSEVLSVVMSRW